MWPVYGGGFDGLWPACGNDRVATLGRWRPRRAAPSWIVIPAEAGIHFLECAASRGSWIPACAGMTEPLPGFSSISRDRRLPTGSLPRNLPPYSGRTRDAEAQRCHRRVTAFQTLAFLYEKARDVLAAGMDLTHSARRRRRKTG